MKVLIVDDSSIVRSRIKRLMEAPGMPALTIVGVARNGVEAVALFRQTSPDIVTMDLTMPEMDGVECTETLVNLNPDVNILVVSALSDKATAIEALKKGARGFLYKPFTDEQLISAFQELID